MRKILLLAFVCFISFTAFGQDFSNKGMEFWTCFPNHVPSGANGRLTIWITSDQASSGVVSVTNGSLSVPFTVAANGIVPIDIPWGNAHILNSESGIIIQKSIRIKVNTGQPPVVAYAQQYGNARSAATLLLPTSVLGKKYRAFSHTYTATSAGSPNQAARSHFQIIATQPNTQVEVTPFSNGVKGITFTIVFPNVGDMYQYQATSDVTGTLIESIATGSGSCLPIAVFSGSSAVTIGSTGPNCTGSSYDPLFQQCYPVTTWGKNYGFIPFGDYTNRGNPYRVMAAEDNTTVSLNGSVVATLNAGQIYPPGFTATPGLLNQVSSITADKPISVAHYLQTSACSGSNNGDPDMVLVNPIEQNIKDITVFASTQENITRQWINVLIPTVAAGSFKIDGVAPLTAFVPAANIPGYSYLRHMFSPTVNGSHYLTADSGFNAVLYGYQGGQFESYAYSAGTNVIDLSKELELETTYGIETSPSICTNAPFKFKFYIPDSTLGTPPVAIRFDSLRWDLSNPSLIVPNNFPIMVYPPCGPPCTVAYDSITIKNGKQVTWYSLPTTYYFNAAGNDTLLVTGYTSTNEGCGANKLYDFPIVISDPPLANFDTLPAPGCYLEPVVVTETTPQIPKTTYRQWWEFFDPVTNVTTVYTNAPPNPPTPIRNVSHTFTTPGVKRIRHASITTPGCLSDTIVKFVTLSPIPTATISGNTTPFCINTPVGPDVTFTATDGTAPYTFSYTINGVLPAQTINSIGTNNFVTIQAPTNVAGPFTYELVGVRNATPAGTPCTRNITGQTITVNITPDATVTLASAVGTDNQTVCVNNAINNIRYNIGGSGNGGTVSGLPPGVTGTYSGGIITILGAPTTAVGSPFTYTINPTGPCAVPLPPVTGIITVNDDATIALTSAAGTNNQTICINTPITDIDYLVARGGTGATIAWTLGVPPGINFIPLGGGGFRITGILGATGTFNYTITTTGPCINPTATGSITGNPDHTIGFNSGTPNPTLCVNTLMASFTLQIGGGATGITSAGLPPGVTATLGAGGIVTISGTPTSAIGSPFNYTIATTGNTCVIASYSNTITVTEDATITHLSGSTNQAVCRNTPIGAIDYLIGGSATGATITWAMPAGAPAGISFTPTSATTFQIAGTPTNVGTTTYNYTITTTGPCVNPPITGSITVNALPIASFNAAPIRCANRDISFTNTSTPNAAGTTIWAWDFGDPPSGPFNTSPLQNPTHKYLVPNTTTGYTVTLIVTNSNNCVSDPIASMVVMVNDTPRADFLVPEVCINDVATVFTDISSINAGNSITSWFWDFGDPPSGPLNTSTTQHGTHLYPSPNNYTVEHKAISNFGCRDSITHVITINSADPVSNFTVNNSCSSDSVALTNLSTVGFGNVTRLDIYWDNVGAPLAVETINTPAFNAVYKHKYPTLQTTQNYTIRMVAYSGNVCFTSTTRIVTVYATPIVQFNNIPPTCYLVAPFQITQGSEIGGVPGTGTYSGPGITNPNGTFDPVVAGIGTHDIKYTWTASNAGACIDTLTRTITVLDTAHARFSYVLPACEQTPVSFTNLSTAPASVTLTSTVWDFGDATGLQTFAIAAPITHTYTNPGPYTVTMHTVDNNSPTGCLSTDTSAVINIDANHHITWDAASGSQNQALCVNTSITPIRYTLSGGATNINFIPALPAGLTYTLGGTPLTLTIQGAPTSASGFNFGIQTTGNTCQFDNANVTITVAPDHEITRIISAGDSAQSVCVNTAIDAITYNLSGGATGIQMPPAGLPPGVTATVSGSTVTISGSPTAVGTYNYTIQTTGNACIIASAIGEIKVHPYPVPAFTFDKGSYCIPNANVGFINNTTPAPLSNHTYAWDFGDGGSSSAVSPSHLYSTAGPFTVTLKARSTVLLNHGVIGCESIKSNLLDIIHPQPKADFVFSKPSVCIGDNVLITDNTDGKDGIVNQWHWDLGDGTTRVTNPITHTYGDTIQYTITMYSINTHGCNSDTISKPFTVYPYPHVNAGPDKFVLEGGSVELESVTFANNAQYTWTPDLYLTDARIARPRVMNPKTDMTYLLTVTGMGGCAAGDNVFVKLLKFPAIPNTFTPNGDGINDTWRIDYLNTYPNNRIQIFTRGGNLVFESRGYNTPWDGTLKGKPLPFDTYYYIIEPGNGRDPITGYVTIIK